MDVPHYLLSYENIDRLDAVVSKIFLAEHGSGVFALHAHEIALPHT